MKRTSGSTHEMNIANIIDDERKFFVKFSDSEFLDDDTDPSVQCMSEYLAYKIYSLYPSIKIPARIELVYDPQKSRVGLATSAVKGKPTLGNIKPQQLAKQLQAGVYVDIFMANWDVVGTGSGNLMSNDEDNNSVVRIDPGSAFKYRAQGGRKGSLFNASASELNTMLDPKFNRGNGAGGVYQYADLQVAAEEFMKVSWSVISSTIDKIHDDVVSELQENDMQTLMQQWNAEVNDIKTTLAQRYKVVLQHAKKILTIM